MKAIRRLLSLARDSRFALVITVLSGFLAGLLIIGQAAGLSRVVAGVFLDGKRLQESAELLRLLALIVFMRAGLAWVSETSGTALAVKIKSNLRQRLFSKLLCLGPAYTQSQRTGELVNSAVEGVEELDAFFSQYLPQLFLAALVPLSILIVVFPRDPISGLVLLLTAPLIPIFIYLIGKTAEKLTKRQWDTLGSLSAHFLDSLHGLTTLKELGRSKEHANSITETSNRFRDVTLGVLRFTFLSALVLELVATVSTAVVAVEVGLRLLYGHLVFQQAFFLLLLAPELYIPLRMLGLRFHVGMSGATAARRIFEILDAPVPGDHFSQIVERNGLQSSFSPIARIAFENLSYIHPGEVVPALREISLEIHTGEHVALVGSSGAGKSTIAALLLGFIRPTSGMIVINDDPLSRIPMESWRDLVAWVPQDPYLFHETIAANLRLARPDASEEHLFASIKAAHLDQFVQSLPHGYETMVGEEGARLSSGQAQRIALARAFLKNAPILILDEPTSSLDPGQEELVEKAIHTLMEGRTVITIAHRLNTVFQADRIFVLEQGSLVETGTHRDLMEQGGIYSQLVGASLQTMDFNARSQVQNEIVDIIPASPVSSPPTAATPDPFSAPIFRLLGFLKGSWSWVVFSVLLGVLTVGSNVGLMGTSAYLVSSAGLHPELGALQVAIVGVRFFGISRGVFRYAERLVSHSVTFRVLARLRDWFYRALEPLAPARLMQYRSGDVLSRIVADVETLENFYVRVVNPPMVALIAAIGMLIFFSLFDLQLAGAYLGIMLVLGIGIPVLSWLLNHHPGAEWVTRRAALQARLVDGIQGLADILAASRGRDFAEKLLRDENACSQTRQQLGSLNGFSNALVTLALNLGMLAILALAIPLVASGQLSGVMLAVLTLSAPAGLEGLIPLTTAAQTLSSSMQAARRLFEVVDAEPTVRDGDIDRNDSLSFIPSAGHLLRIKDLGFSYPGQSEPALQDINFQLAPGNRIAIVGPSGAGKTTLVNLLLRYWDFSAGQIILDGCDLHGVNQETVRRMFSVITQRTFFFNDTIRKNLLLACPTASKSEIQNAAEQAQIQEFISGLPKGYETIIGERGFRLSGGERQRLAIARAILKRAPIFLLDEPTANLDTINERRIQDILLRSAADRSLLLITHRLVGLENMDEILVLDHGCIIERGTHAELLSLGGLYNRLWDIQNRILHDKSGA